MSTFCGRLDCLLTNFLGKSSTQTGKIQKRRAPSAKILKSLRPIRKTEVSKKSRKTQKGLWPEDGLFFKTFPEDEAYTYLYEVLLERGWKYAGVPYKGEDPSVLEKVVKKQQPK